MYNTKEKKIIVLLLLVFFFTIIGFFISQKIKTIKCIADLNNGKNRSDLLVNKIVEVKRNKRDYQQLFDYFACRLRYDYDNEEMFEEFTGYVIKLTLDDEHREKGEKQMEISRDWLYSHAARSEVVLKPIEEICVGRQVKKDYYDLCVSMTEVDEDIEYKYKKIIEDRCRNFCINWYDHVEKYRNTPSQYIQEFILNKKNWSEDEKIYSTQYLSRAAAAYVLGGKELSDKVCKIVENVSEIVRERCYRLINIIDYRKKCYDSNDFEVSGNNKPEYCEIPEECEILRSKLADSICENI